MAVRAVKGTLFSTVAQERDTVVRPHGSGVEESPGDMVGFWELGPESRPRGGKGPHL